MKSIRNIAGRIQRFLMSDTQPSEPVLIHCNYSDDYYGDKVCVIRSRR